MNREDKVIGKIPSLNKHLKDLQSTYNKLGEDIVAITVQIRNLELELSSNYESKPKHFKPKPRRLSLNSYRRHIGARVRILNPKTDEPNIGRVTKVGKLYVIIELTNNQLTRRIPKNIELLEHE